MSNKKTTLLVAIGIAMLNGCQSTNTSTTTKNDLYTVPQVLPEAIEYHPSFLFRYKDILNAEQKRLLWDIVDQDYKEIQSGLVNTTFDERGKNIQQQEYSFIGSMYSSLRTANYVSGIIKFEGDEIYASASKFKLLTSSIYDNKVIPAFKKIAHDFDYSYQCVYGCDDKANKIYQFTSVKGVNTNDPLMPKKLYASVCLSKQKNIHNLNAKFYDPNGKVKALFTNPYDGFNIIFSFLDNADNVDFTNVEAISKATRYNRRCMMPKGATDAFNLTIGREFYRSVSASIPEYFATLNSSNEFALYQGNIWKLNNKDNAKLFHGNKTIN